MDKTRIEELLHLLVTGTSTAAHRRELYKMYGNPANEQVIKDLIEKYWDHEAFSAFLSEQESEALYRSIQEQIPVGRKTGHVRNLKRLLVAASVLGVIALSWSLIHRKAPLSNQASQAGADNVLAPVSPKAHIVSETGIVKRLEGKTEINTAESMVSGSESDFFTLVNPRGSRSISLTLADGTRLWLNAGSSIKYPAVFSKQERRVTVTGEAYFEVMPDKSKPFMVNVGNAEVRVIGTHFNVNSFNDKVRVTLLEGKVNVSSDLDSGILHPGQTALVDENIDVVAVDTTTTMAWKNDVFDFNQTALTEIMEEIGRWYDVNIVYKESLPDITLSGTVKRSYNITQVLKMLELSSGFKFRLQGREVTVNNK